MKHLFTLTLGLVTFFSSGQTSFSVAQEAPALPISANATVNISTSLSTSNVRTLHLQNISNATKEYNVKKYVINLHSTATSTAEASFAFGGCDFGPQTSSGLCTLTLTSGQSSSALGDYFSLECRLTEANTVGFSLVKYTIYNINQVSDSLQFTLRYNFVQSATQLLDLQQSVVLKLQPNPAKDLTTLQITSPNASEAILQITDISGKEVLSQKNTLLAGDNKIDVKLLGLSPGLYYLHLQSQSAVLIRKFVIE